MAQLGRMRVKLDAMGVEILGVIEDRVEPVRRYFHFQPPKARFAADPERGVHLAYGLPRPLYAAPEYARLRETTLINPTGEAPEAMPTPALNNYLNERDRLAEIPEAKEVRDQFPSRDFNLHAGHFLIDREGVVRRTWVETPASDLSRWGLFPSESDIVDAVRAAKL